MSKALPPIEAAEPGKKDDIPDYEVDSAMETMLRAEEHKSNPKLMKKVHAKLGVKKQAITSIQGLKQRKAELLGEE